MFRVKSAEVDRKISFTGRAIELTFHAGPDAVGGSLKTLVKHVDDAFDLLRLALAEPRFDADAVERVRAQTIAGLRYQANDPGVVASKRFFAEAFPDHPYGRPTGGTLESVFAITRDDLVRLHRTIVTRDRVRVAGVGARALQAGFRETVGMTPLAYLRKVRLDRVRAELMETAGERSVTDVALRCGFTHLGGGLETKGGSLKGFTIAGPDGKYVTAQAEIKGDSVIV